MCEHNTTVVIYSGKDTSVEICEWGCDRILVYKIMPDGTTQLVREVEHPKLETAYNAALEWAANWIIGAQLSGHGVEVQRYANTMAMSIRAAKRVLPR